MGTNFYFMTKNKDLVHKHFAVEHSWGVSDEEYRIVEDPYLGFEIHLNKLSFGWRPLFQKHKEFSSWDELEAFNMAISALEAQEAKAQLSAEGTTSDLISRQAAIDALMDFDKKLRKINWYQYPHTEYECRGVDEAIVKIENVPSAQQVRTQMSSADDLISRHAAIDILDAYQVMVENGEENPYAWARLRMSELPPAQPEQKGKSNELGNS